MGTWKGKYIRFLYVTMECEPLQELRYVAQLSVLLKIAVETLQRAYNTGTQVVNFSTEGNNVSEDNANLRVDDTATWNSHIDQPTEKL